MSAPKGRRSRGRQAGPRPMEGRTNMRPARWGFVRIGLATVLVLAATVLLLSACSLPKIGGGGGGDTTTLSFNPEDLIPATSDTVSASSTSVTQLGASTSLPAQGGYATPEEAVQAAVGEEWVVSIVWEQGSEAEAWAGPPYSEFVVGLSLAKTAAGWEVTGQWDLDTGDETAGSGSSGGGSSRSGSSGGGSSGGGYTDLVGGPWYESDFPEIYRPGSGYYKEFRTDSYPRPANKSYPSSGDAWIVWDSLGRMLNYMKEGRVADGTRYVTADFYKTFFFDMFNEVEVYVDEFELTGWEDLGDGFYAVWANLYYGLTGGGRYSEKAIFVGSVNGAGVGIMVDADLWEPVDN